MASQSNRSASPLSSKPTNPNLRNSENSCATRTSITGNTNNNPFAKPSVLSHHRRFDLSTPVNSPSDCLRRSFGKERMCPAVGDWEEKENEKDNNNMIKASKLRNSGSKNFMSPTISAASKFTPSPKKRVFVERNDPVRTSISVCDGKALFFPSTNVSQDLGSKSEIASEKKYVVPPVSSKPQKRVTFAEVSMDSQHSPESLSESVITDSDDHNLNNPPVSFSSSSVLYPIAPLDADPSLPPYDPKKNYLSPRPRFLHYRPNPRIEILFNKEKGLDPDGFLEDSSFSELMMSDNSSDSEEVSEESPTNDSQNEELEVINHGCSADMVLGVEEDLHILESLPLSPPVPEDNLVVHKREKKQWGGFSELVCFSVVLMFLIGCVMITSDHSMTLDQPYLKGMSYSDLSKFYHQSGIVISVKLHYDRLLLHVNEFSVNTLAFMSKLIDNVVGEGKRVGRPLRFNNLTDLQNDIWNEGIFLKSHMSSELVENLEEDDDVDTEIDDDVRFEEKEETTYVEEEIGSDESSAMEFDSQQHGMLESKAELELENQEIVESPDQITSVSSEIKMKAETTLEVEIFHGENIIGSNESSAMEFDSQQHGMLERAELELENQEIVESPDQITSVSSEIKMESETTVEVVIFHGENIIGSSSSADVTTLEQHKKQLDATYLNEEVPQSSPVHENQKFLANYVIIGISSLIAAVFAVGAFVFQEKKNCVVEHTEPLLSEHHHKFMEEKPFSENWQTEVDECASEMSRSQKNVSSSYYSKKSTDSEFQSVERIRKKNNNSKRESLAFSTDYSTGSPLYGSFTMFEKISTKNALGEDEIITPVRRSSRIRKKVTSP